MVKKLLIILTLFSSLSIFCNQNLSHTNWESETVKIDENIGFYWDKLLSPGDDFSDPDEVVSLPFDWSINPEYSVYGRGTFRTIITLADNIPELAIKLPYTIDSYKVFVNGKQVAQNFIHDSKRRLSTVIIELPGTIELDIIIQVTNENDNHGGITIAPIIGHYPVLVRDLNRAVIFDSFLFGALLLTGLLYCSFYLSKKNEKSALYFGLFSIVLGIRTVLYGEHTLLMIFTSFPLELEVTLGHLTYYIAIPLFIMFISAAFPFRRSKIVLMVVNIFSGAFCLFAILLTNKLLIQILYIYQIFSLIICSFAFLILIRRAFGRNKPAIFTLIGFSVLLITGINDILLSQEIITSIHLTSSGMIIFIMSQGILLSLNIAKSLSRSESLAIELLMVNKSFKRFVPEEFLNILERSQVSDIKLGDHVQLNMTIMFCDIRDFTTLSEKMTPRENFLFINSFLERIGPVVRQYGGFIDKYMGDGVMSLFPEGADSAVNAAIAIQKTVEIYNSHRNNSGYDNIKLGIGINTGSLMLGTIGENERMDGTVISDAVNICSRIESITKEYGLSIAISEQTYINIYRKDKLFVRNIGKIFLKGKKKPVSVYELFNMDSEQSIKLKLKSKDEFENAIELYESGNTEEAKTLFNKILQKLPNDIACSNYLNKIRDPDNKRGNFAIY